MAGRVSFLNSLESLDVAVPGFEPGSYRLWACHVSVTPHRAVQYAGLAFLGGAFLLPFLAGKGGGFPFIPFLGGVFLLAIRKPFSLAKHDVEHFPLRLGVHLLGE